MALLIDTYNVLHVTGVLPPEQAGIDVGDLVALIETSRFRRQRAVLVCDGHRPEGVAAYVSGPIRVVYAGGRRTADDVIIAAIDRSSTPRRLTIVSSDQQILRAARRRRCRMLDSAEFLRQLAATAGQSGADRMPTRPQHPLGEDQVDEWLEQFGLRGNELEEFAPPEEPAPPAPQDQPAPMAAEPPDTSAEEEVEEWLDQFGLTGDELDEFAPLEDPPPPTPTGGAADAPPADELPDETPAPGGLLPPHIIEEAERLEDESRKAEEPKSRQQDS